MKQVHQNEPHGWVQKKLVHLVAATQLGGDYPSALGEKGTPLVKMINIGRGVIINCDKIERIDDSIELSKRDYLQAGDLLLNTRNSLELVGKVALWRDEAHGAVFNNNLMRIEFKPSAGLVNEYANLWFNSHDGIRQLRRIAIGTTSVAAIYWRDLASLKVSVPPPAEQRKIADILTTWDEALTQLDALIEAQERRKKALMQQLLTRASSKAGTRHARQRMGCVLERVTRRNSSLDDNVLTISAQGGLVSQKEYFNRSVAGADLSGYYLLHRGEFAYNRSYSKGYPYGALKRLDQFDSGVVSTLYLCFRIKEGAAVSPEYLVHYFEGGRLNSGLRCIAKEGARAHGLLNVTADEFFDLDIFLPSLPEQQKIAEILDTADQQLTLLRTQRTALDQQKRGLMQRLLTGKLRVRTTS